MANDASVLLRGAWEEARHVDERDQRDVERVAEAHEPRALVRRVDVERARHHLGLVGHDADRLAVEVREPDHHVHGVERLHLEEVAVVDDGGDHVLDVVRLFGVVGYDRRQRRSLALGVVGRLHALGLVVAALRDVREQPADLGEALRFALRQEVRHARLHVVHLGAAERVEGHVLARGHANDLGPGDEHVADAVDHEREVGDGRRVHGPAGAGSEDEADLRDHPAGLDVAPEDLSVAGKRDHALLDARPARVVDADDRDAVGVGEVHDFDHLLGENLAQRAAENARVVAEQHHVAAADLRQPRDHAVAGHPVAVAGEEVDLLERVAVDQARDPLPSGELALGVLALERLRIAVAGLVLALAQLVERVDPVRLAGRGHFWMNIQRWPSKSSAR